MPGSGLFDDLVAPTPEPVVEPAPAPAPAVDPGPPSNIFADLVAEPVTSRDGDRSYGWTPSTPAEPSIGSQIGNTKAFEVASNLAPWFMGPVGIGMAATEDGRERYDDMRAKGHGVVASTLGGAAQGAVDLVAPKAATKGVEALRAGLRLAPAATRIGAAATHAAEGAGTGAMLPAGSAAISAASGDTDRAKSELKSIPESAAFGAGLGGLTGAATGPHVAAPSGLFSDLVEPTDAGRGRAGVVDAPVAARDAAPHAVAGQAPAAPGGLAPADAVVAPSDAHAPAERAAVGGAVPAEPVQAQPATAGAPAVAPSGIFADLAPRTPVAEGQRLDSIDSLRNRASANARGELDQRVNPETPTPITGSPVLPEGADHVAREQAPAAAPHLQGQPGESAAPADHAVAGEEGGRPREQAAPEAAQAGQVGAERVDRSHDVPLFGGTSADGRTVYIDRDAPRTVEVNGKPVDVDKYTAIHERAEKPLLDQGMSYADAHDHATAVENAALRADGHDPAAYNAALKEHIDAAAAKSEPRVPPDIERKPYDESGVKLPEKGDDLIARRVALTERGNDGAVVNTPLAKRGDIDAQIDRHKEAQARSRAERFRDARKATDDRRTRLRALPDEAFTKVAEKAGLTLKQARKQMLHMAAVQPEATERWLAEHESAPESPAGLPAGGDPPRRFQQASDSERMAVAGREPVAKLDEQAFSGGNKERHEQAAAWAADNIVGKHFTNREQGWDIRVTSTGVEHALAKSRGIIPIEAIRAIPRVLEDGVLTRSEPDKEGRRNIAAVHRIVAPVEIGGQRYGVKATVREIVESGQHFYEYRLLEVEPPAASDMGASPKGVGPSAAGSSGDKPTASPADGQAATRNDATGVSAARPDETPPEAPTAHALRTGGAVEGVAKATAEHVATTAAEAKTGLAEAADDIRKVFAPQGRSTDAARTGGILREHGATLAQRTDQASAAFKEAGKTFDRLSEADRLDFINRMETGRAQATPEHTQIAAAMRSAIDGRRVEVQQLGTGKLQHFINDYFPHIWEDPVTAGKAFGSKRPIEGGKGFLKKRSIPTIADGIALGLKPVSTNPVDLMLLKLREMDKYILGQKAFAELKEKGLAQFVRATERPPEGLAKINDKIAQVYGPPTVNVSEHVDKAVLSGLRQTMDNLGIEHARKPSLGRGVLGLSYTGTDKIETRGGTELGVMAHEIGHQLDDKLGLSGILTAQAPEAEMRALGDLHEHTDPSYFYSPAERTASVVEAYVQARDRFKQIAPKTYDVFTKFLDSNPDLHALRDISPSLAVTEMTHEQAHGGVLKYGEYMAAPEVAQVLNNYLSPGLREKSALFRGFLGVGNAMNQASLGLSAYHLGFTSVEAATSKVALAIEHAVSGEVGAAIKSAASAPAAPLTNFLAGSKVLREWFKPGSQGGDAAQMVDAIRRAGGRAKMDGFHGTGAADKMTKAFREGNVFGGLLHAPGAALDLAAKPIMEYIVPRQKLGVFADLARRELKKLGPNPSAEDVRAVMGKAWDSVDNRMGQMVYDNLFWNKTAKDLAMASVRSVGWNLGTIRELGGGAKDAASAAINLVRGRKAEVTHRMAYAAAMPLVSGLLGAVTYYLYNGKGPETLRDCFFPRTGEKDEHGDDVRASLPTYMKDVYHYAHDPVGTVLGKVHPLITTVADMLRNKDFFDTPIRNSDDPMVKQAADLAKFAGQQFVPFAVRNSNAASNTVAGKAAAFVGVTKAPKFLSQSQAEQVANDIGGSHHFESTLTPAQKAARNGIIAADRAGDGKTADRLANEAVQSGTLTPRQIHDANRRGTKAPLGERIQAFSVPDAMRVWRVATPEERASIKVEMVKKIQRAKTVSQDAKSKLLDRIEADTASAAVPAGAAP